MASRVVLVGGEGNLTAISLDPRDVDGVVAVNRLGTVDNSDVVRVQVGLLGAVAAFGTFNGLNDREGYSGTVQEQLAALRTVLPGASVAKLVELGQLHAADQFARWLGEQFVAEGRAPSARFAAQQDGRLRALPGQSLTEATFRGLLNKQFGGQGRYVAYRAVSAGSNAVELAVWVFDGDLNPVAVENPFADHQVAAKKTVTLVEAKRLLDAGLARLDSLGWCSGTRTEGTFGSAGEGRVTLFVTAAGTLLADLDPNGDAFVAVGTGKKVRAFSVTGNGFAAGDYAFLAEDDVFIQVGRFTTVCQLVDGVLETVDHDDVQDWLEDGTIVLPA